MLPRSSKLFKIKILHNNQININLALLRFRKNQSKKNKLAWLNMNLQKRRLRIKLPHRIKRSSQITEIITILKKCRKRVPIN